MHGSSRRRVLLSSLAAAGLLSAGAKAQDDLADDEEIAGLLRARIDVQKRGTCAAAGVLRSGRLSFIGHGVVELDRPRPVARGAVFQVASLTKIMTALLLADAAARGELGLEDPLDSHIPAPAPSFGGRAITLLDLATHTSALPLRPPSRADRGQDDPYAGYAEDDLYTDIRAVGLTRAPGEAFEYSNFGYGLLGAALGNRIGRSFRELLEERLLDPLDMSDTMLGPAGASRRRRVQGYDSELQPMRPWDFGALAPAGGAFSTIPDMIKLVSLWHGADERGSRGRLSRAARSMLAVSRPGDDAETRMALGWRVVERGGRRLAWSNGSGGGVRSFMGLAVEGAVGVVAFANMATGGGVDDIGLHVLDATAPVNVDPAPERVAIEVAPEVLDLYAGVYEEAPGTTLAIERVDDGLALVVPGGRLALLAETSTRFFIREVDITLELIVTDGAARQLVVTQDGKTYLYDRVM